MITVKASQALECRDCGPVFNRVSEGLAPGAVLENREMPGCVDVVQGKGCRRGRAYMQEGHAFVQGLSLALSTLAHDKKGPSS